MFDGDLKTALDVQHLSRGYYLLKLRNGQNESHSRIIVQ
jgi:hypothetical protein